MNGVETAAVYTAEIVGSWLHHLAATRRRWSALISALLFGSAALAADLEALTTAAEPKGPPSRSKVSPRYLSAEWLEKGCIALIVYEKDRSNLAPAQDALGARVMAWIDGWLLGVSSMTVSEAKAKPTRLFEVPLEWTEPRRVAPLLLAFMNKNRGVIKPETPASRVMLGWYLASHPEATESERWLGTENLAELLAPSSPSYIRKAEKARAR
jgi:hypothetical protein